MILDSGISSSDTKIKDDNYKMKNSKIKMLYLGIMCFATNFLSSIALEAGSNSLFRSISPHTRPVMFNNLFLRNYNLKIKIMVGDVLAALVSTTMLTIGDTYGIPYLYLPWLVNTIEGMVLHEGPALLQLVYTLLPNANLLMGLFMFITLLLYVEELCIWKDVFVNFERCWTKYNKNKKLKEKAKSMKIENKELCNVVKDNLVENIISQKETTDRQDSTFYLNKTIGCNNHDIIEYAAKNMRDNTSIKSLQSKGSLMKISG
ncbi:hypothetical protein PUN28_004560 [Cardiocondyla obscurior]|uniref:Uncharacterized protein n=1 Tax=Cardiocondyla obscurior TaxID=286306 RepID=A0AAW2GEE2_9HYME